MTMQLSSGAVHLYLTFPDEIRDQQLLAEYQTLLNSAEQARWKRFYFDRHRHHYLVTRALIRSTLSRYMDKHPRDWCFSSNQYGRPEIIRKPDEPPIRFNLSHTDGLIICGIVLEDDIGVDVEDLHRKNATADIAGRYFSVSEVEALNTIPAAQRTRRFFDYWTLKEAYIKARGMGLSLPLDQFSFHFDHLQTAHIAFDSRLKDNPQQWQFWRLQPSDKHVAAIAVKSPTYPAYQLTTNTIVPLQSQ